MSNRYVDLESLLMFTVVELKKHKDWLPGQIATVESFKLLMQSLQLRDNKYVVDMDTVTPQEAFEKAIESYADARKH